MASPCPASWEQMTGDERIRHCTECDLNVYNFSSMTEREIADLLLQREGRICGRFYRRRDGTILTKDCPRGLRAAAQRLARVAGAALSVFMSLGFAAAQTPASDGKGSQDGSVQNNQTSADRQEAGITVTVHDSQGTPVRNAEVALTRFGRTKIIGNTDSSGVLSVSGLASGSYGIEVQSPNFDANWKKVKLRARQVLDLKVVMQPSSETVLVGVIEPSPMEQSNGGHTFTAEDIERLM